MFLMCLKINRQGWRQEPLIENQWQSDDEEDEFDIEYEIKLEEVEDVREIFYLICEELENSNIVQFRVEGFGEVPWPVDVSTDLLTVLEQLSDLLKFLDEPEFKTGNLDFYEQGIQRRIKFRKLGDTIELNCKPFPDINSSGSKPSDPWGQDIEEEPIEKKLLKTMICQILESFVSIANEICPNLTSHKCFQEWCGDQYIASCLKRSTSG